MLMYEHEIAYIKASRPENNSSEIKDIVGSPDPMLE